MIEASAPIGAKSKLAKLITSMVNRAKTKQNIYVNSEHRHWMMVGFTETDWWHLIAAVEKYEAKHGPG